MRILRTTIVTLTVGILAAMPAAAGAIDNQAAANIPKSAIAVADPQFEFGRVAQGASVAHTFWMKNVSDSAFRINDVKPGCGCTKAPFEPTTLAPGDSTHVDLIFSTGHYSSHVTKNARILSDDPGQMPSLIFHADVRPHMDSLDIFSVQPYAIDLDQNDSADDKYELEYRLAVRNLSDRDLTFRLADVPEGLVTLDFPEGKAVHPGEQLKFEARFDKGIAPEVFTKSFTIEASDNDHTRLTVPISKTLRWGPAATSQR